MVANCRSGCLDLLIEFEPVLVIEYDTKMNLEAEK
jgi:hypothetical protein